MKVFYYLTTIKPASYLHVFSGKFDPEGYAIIDKSFVKFGTPKVHFAEHGSKLMVNKDSRIELSDVPYALINMLFDGDLNLDLASFQQINLGN